MSLYQFAPGADVSSQESMITWWDNGFSQDEIQKLVSYGNLLVEQNGNVATVGEQNINEQLRRSTVAWIENVSEMNWLYDKMAYIARQVNSQFFQFDLFGFMEDFQYTIYKGDSEAGDHYDWHIDKGYKPGQPPRKLSMVVNLSDPSEYEGGDLLFHGDKGIEIADKTQGKIHIFPSFLLHRVTPVTRGTRRTLVSWICGNKFR